MTAGYFLPWLFLTKPPVATQVDAAHKRKFSIVTNRELTRF